MRDKDKINKQLSGEMIQLRKRVAELEAGEEGRQKMEKALKAEHDFSATVLDTVDSLVIVLDTDGRIVTFNRACESCTGYSLEEVKGKIFWDFLLLPEETGAVKTVFQKLKTEEPANRFVNHWKTKDGRMRLIECSNATLNGPDGLPEYVMSTGIDITERREAEEELRYRADFERLITRISVGFINLRIDEIEQGIIEALKEIGEFFIVDRMSVFLFSDDYSIVRNIAQWTRKEEMYLPAGKQELPLKPHSWFLDKMKTHEAVQIVSVDNMPEEHQALRESLQSLGHKSWTAVPLFQADTLIGVLSMVSLTVERAWSEETIQLLRIVAEIISNLLERQKMEVALRKSEEQRRLALEAARVVTWEWDLRTDRITWAEGLENVFGIRDEDLEYTSLDFFEILHSEDVERVKQVFQDTIAHGTPFQVEYRIKRPDETLRWVSSCGQTYLDPAGKPHRMLGTIEDITERKYAERELQHRLDFEDLITTISTQFINLPTTEMDNGINQALRKVGKFADMDQSYVFLLSEDGNTMSCAYEWCNEGFEPQMKYLQNIKLDTEYPWYAEKLRRLETIHVPRVTDLPDEAEAERREFEREGLQSLVDVPMISGGSLVGFLGLSTIRKETTWGEEFIALLKIVGEIFVNALERRRREGELRESEARLAEAQRIAKIGNWDWDIVNDTIHRSEEIYRIFGLDPQKKLDSLEMFWDSVHPGDREFVKHATDQALHEKKPYNLDYRIVRPDGSVHTIHAHAEVIHDDNGTAIRMVGTDQDITERKLAEEALAESELRYRTLFESAGDAIFLMDRDTFIDCNPISLATFGCTRDQIIGQPPYVLSPPLQPDGRQSKEKALEKIEVALAGKPQFFEWRHVRFDGTLFDAEVTLTRIELKDKIFIQAIVRDITNRKRVEEELRASEEKYRFLFEESPASYTIIGLDFEIQDANRSTLNTLGYSKEELIGKKALDLIVPEQRQQFMDIWKKRFRGEVVDATEVEVYARDGSPRVLFSPGGQAVRLLEGDRVTGILTSSIDITERKRAEALARQQQEQLFRAAKMVSLGTLISGFGHEVNNPNNYIRLNAQGIKDFWGDIEKLLDREFKDNEDLSLKKIPYLSAKDMINGMVEGILEGSVRIEKLLVDLSNFVREQKGDLDQSVDINRVVDSALKLTGSIIRKSTSRFSCSYTEDLPSVRGNAHQLEQVFINLLTNACQALTTRGQAITVSTDQEDVNWIAVLVKDEGVGIPDENISQITDPFFTTKREVGGTGLGLSVSYQIIRDHGGELVFQSEPGKGTVVRIRLPI